MLSCRTIFAVLLAPVLSIEVTNFSEDPEKLSFLDSDLFTNEESILARLDTFTKETRAKAEENVELHHSNERP